MITWNNLDTLASFKELEKVERVNLVEAMTGESGAERVKNYSVPMAEGLTYNYAAKQVDDKVLAALAKLADEAHVCLIKNLINLLSTQTGGVGELSNFILGCAFVLPAGLIYKHKKSKKSAVLGALLGAVIMAAFSMVSNYYIVYPIYTKFMPMDVIIAAYSSILPSIKNLWQALFIFNLPFTFAKGLVNVLIATLIYKPLSPILKGKNI